MKKTKFYSYYLPQFHEIPENNLWWGKGFTEWNCVNEHNEKIFGETRKPRNSIEEYNLLNPNALKNHALVAENFGLSGFFVWQYWFGDNEMLLEKPMELVLKERIVFPYAFFWANHTWYNKGINKLLKKQNYLGEKDYVKYFEYCLPHFNSESYLKIDGKPIFGIFDPKSIPDLDLFIKTFRYSAKKSGFPDLFLISENTQLTDNHTHLFDKFLNTQSIFDRRKKVHPFEYIKEQLIKRANLNFLGPVKYDFKTLSGFYQNITENEKNDEYIPSVISGWNTTPRHKSRGTIYQNFNPQQFQNMLQDATDLTKNKNTDNRIVILKSWNEWAEGNILEADNIYGDELLKVLKKISGN